MNWQNVSISWGNYQLEDRNAMLYQQHSQVHFFLLAENSTHKPSLGLWSAGSSSKKDLDYELDVTIASEPEPGSLL